MSRKPPQSSLRHGLIENAAGQLICPTCKEPLTEVLLAHAVSELADTTVLPHEVRSFHIPRPQYKGLAGITVGMVCKHDHHVFLGLICDEGTITVKTEWGADEEEGKEGGAGR